MISEGWLKLEDNFGLPCVPSKLIDDTQRLSSNLLANIMFSAGIWSKEPKKPLLLPFLALELIQILAKLMQAQIQTVKIPVLVYNNPSTAQAGVI